MSSSFRLGDTTVTRVEDNLGPSLEVNVMFPGFRRAIFEAERDWLVPTFLGADGTRLRTSIHSWLVRTPHHTILIDSCIGNDKARSLPHFHMRSEPWLERLAAAGARPEDVDFVMCTHLHADHVGWNTRLVDGRWVPTFPRAKYLFGRTEFERWDPRRPGCGYNAFNAGVFEDSILPVVAAEQMILVDAGHAPDERLTIEAAPGHTPGHVKIRLQSDGSEGMFSGDILHHPLQVPYPELCSMFDDDMGRALHTRLALLGDIADRDVLLFTAHFAEPHVCRVTTRGARFALDWVGAHR